MDYIMCANEVCRQVSMTPISEPTSGGAVFGLLILVVIVGALLFYVNETRKAKDMLANKLKLTHEERSRLRWL